MSPCVTVLQSNETTALINCSKIRSYTDYILGARFINNYNCYQDVKENFTTGMALLWNVQKLNSCVAGELNSFPQVNISNVIINNYSENLI